MVPLMSAGPSPADVSGTLSSSAEIKCGVHQGSILGPLLFFIYVVNKKLLLYADDSAILVADKHMSNIEKLLKRNLRRLVIGSLTISYPYT